MDTPTTGTPVLFIHGLWLHATSWQPWIDHFRAHGYAPVAPGWPHEPATVEEARADPGAVAGTGVAELTAHFAAIIEGFEVAPVVIGHSFGGLVAQKLLGMGLGRAAVAIDPAQFRGVRALPFSQLRSGFPVLSRPGNKKKSVSLTPSQFRYGFGNAVSRQESDALHEQWTIPSPGLPLFEAATANLHRDTPASVDTDRAPRGPLLLVSGLRDHTVPDVVTRAAHRLYTTSPAVTDLEQLTDRGHSLTVDHGWQEVADRTLGWLTRQGITGRSEIPAAG